MIYLVLSLVFFIIASLIWLLLSFVYKKRKYEDEKKYEILYKETLVFNETSDLNNSDYLNYKKLVEEDDSKIEEKIENYLRNKRE